MDKMKLAHEMALEIMKARPELMAWQIADRAWEYVDAMQAEADERNKAEAEQKRKEMREMLNADNTFIEREGQHFDDVCSDEMQAQRDAELYGTGFLKVTYDHDGVKYERLNPKTTSICSANMGLDSQVLKEWQPDWSQAPDDVEYWRVSETRGAEWVSVEDRVAWYKPAPLFDYQGDWRESLRRRPL